MELILAIGEAVGLAFGMPTGIAVGASAND
jgi:hypothetical protein